MSGANGDSNGSVRIAIRRRRGAVDHEQEYRACMGPALAHLVKAFPRLTPDDRQDIYADVWTRLLERSREGFWPDRVEAYVVKAVHTEALLERRQRATRNTEPSDPLSGPIAAQLDQGMEESVEGRLDAENIEALIRSLTPLQAKVAKLRFDWGLTPEEISEVLGLKRRRVYKEVDRATVKLRAGATRVREGSHVRRYEKLLRRYLAGTASVAERAEAARLIETSSQARMIATEMFRTSRDVAAALPAPVVVDEASRGRLAEGLVAAKQQLAESLAGAKDQASAAYVRASEVPQQVGQHASALRPGSAALAISGCIATLGGGTICAVEGVNPARVLYDVVDQPKAQAPESKPQDVPAAEAEQPPPPPQLPAASEPGQSASPPESTAQTPKAAPAPPPSEAAPSPAAPQPDFQIEQSQPPAASPPAAAPKGGGGEFF